MALLRGITVSFHGGIEPLVIEFKDETGELTCEDVVLKCIKYVHSKVCVPGVPLHGAMFLPAFGLVHRPKEEIWVPHCHMFQRGVEKNQKYKFRVRFRPPADKTFDVNVLYEYLLLQTLEDFLYGSLGMDKNLSEDKLFGLLVVAMLMPDSIPFDSKLSVDSGFKSRSFNYWNVTSKFSKEIGKHLSAQNLVDRFWVYRQLKSEIKKYKSFGVPQKLGYFKHQFYKLLVESVPSYCIEQYKAQAITKDKEEQVTVVLSLYEENEREPSLYHGEVLQCSVKEIYTMKLMKPKTTTNKSWQVQIDVASGPPQILEFEEEGAAESFITMVQGYYNLCVQYDHCFCKDLQTTHAKIRNELKSFGPLRKHSAESYLEDSTDNKNFLIHESLTETGHFIVVYRQKSDLQDSQRDDARKQLKFPEISLELRGEQFLLKTEEEKYFPDCLSLRRYLRQGYGLQVYPKMHSTVADINEDFGIKIEDYGEDIVTRDAEQDMSSMPLPIIKDDLTIGKLIPDKNPFVKKHECHLEKFERNLDTEQLMLVEVQSSEALSDEGKIANSFRQGLETLLKLHRLKPDSFLKFYTMVVAPNLSVLMEFPPYGDLLTYICQKPQTVSQKVDIMYQIVKILGFMEGKKIFHGSVRLRKFMVFDSQDSGFAHIKLGDSGISSYLDTLSMDRKENLERIPWLSPERRKNLKEITYASECYAVGTTLCEVLYRNDQFQQVLKLSSLSELASYFKEKKVLPCPSFVADRESESSSGDDSSYDLLPAAREVLESVWNDVILKCWAEDDMERPSASTILSTINDLKTKAGEIKGDTVVDQLKEVAYDIGLKEQPWMKKGAKRPSAKDLDNQMDILMRGKYLKNICIDMNDYKNTLGSGYFGRVWKASIRKPHTDLRNANAQNDVWTPVAVKKLRVTSPAEERAFVREVLLACDVNHENCVKVLHLGIDTKGPTGFSHRMMIMEYMNGGSLIEYAAKCGDLKDQATVNKMINVCLDVAKGMVYLSGKSIVHRDLAARNILLCENDGKTTAKVSDFGLARTMESNYRFYKVKPEEKLPFTWMPPECLELEEASLSDFGKFTSLGDVWSFGIVMWEAFSKGQNVKTEIRPSNLPRLLFERYKKGWRLPKREHMGSAVYDVMEKCWQLDPQARPPFVELVEILKSLL